MVGIMYDSLDGKSLVVKTLNSALKVVDYIIENSVEMLEEDERNSLDITHDINFSNRKTLTRKLINSLISFSKEIVRNSLDNYIDMAHSETYSLQLAIFQKGTLNTEDGGKGKRLLKVQNPYMDNTSLRKGSYFDVKINNKLVEDNHIALWAYAHESFRKPSNVNWVSNLIWIGIYDEKYKYSELNSNIEIKFPLRVLLPNTDLKKHFKCAKVSLQVTSKEKVRLYAITDLDEKTGNVLCNFKNVKNDELLTVVYTEDVSIFYRENKWNIDVEDGDDVQLGEGEENKANLLVGLCSLVMYVAGWIMFY